MGFAGNVFKVEQGLNSLHFMCFRTFKAISNAWKSFLVQDWRKLKFPNLFSLSEKELLSGIFPVLAGSMLTLKKEGTRRHWYSISWIFVYLQNQMTQCTFTSQINQFNYEYLEGFHSIRESCLHHAFPK